MLTMNYPFKLKMKYTRRSFKQWKQNRVLSDKRRRIADLERELDILHTKLIETDKYLIYLDSSQTTNKHN